jgi:hypothetical protein
MYVKSSSTSKYREAINHFLHQNPDDEADSGLHKRKVGTALNDHRERDRIVYRHSLY